MSLDLVPISVLIHTRNEAAQIEDCLKSVAGWAAEILAFDMESADETVTLASPHASKVISIPYMAEFDAARNLSAEAATQEWILYLDADERLTDQVKETIEFLVRSNDPDIAGYSLPFRVMSFGTWIQHAGNWWPSYKSPPLLRKRKFHFSGHVHDPAQVDGIVARVEPRNEDDAILHLSHRDLTHYFYKLNRYTTLEALKDGRRGTWQDAARKMGQVFSWYFDETNGKADGQAGLFLAFGSAVYEALAELKRMEAQGGGEVPESAKQFLAEALHGAVSSGSKQTYGPPRVDEVELPDLGTIVDGMHYTNGDRKSTLVLPGGTIGITWPGFDGEPRWHVRLIAHRNALNVMGGGEVQLFSTLSHLPDEGVSADVGIGMVPPSGQLLHLFSLHHEPIIDGLMLADRPHVISPIYWDRAELAWAGPKIIAAAEAAETLPALVSAFDSLRAQADELRSKGAFTSRLPENIQALIKRARYILPNANCELEMLRRSVDFELPPSMVVHNAGRPDALEDSEGNYFRDIDIPLPKEPFVLCGGRVEVNKNQIALCVACRILGVPLVIAGGEPDPHYADLCRRIAGPSALFLGPLHRKLLKQVMLRAEIHALPSFAETPGLANLEAVGSDCLLVCSNRGAEREYFGDAAEYCDPLDIGSIVEALSKSLKATNHPYPTIPTWKHVASKTAAIYREILH